MSQHRILDLERGSSTAAGDKSGKSSNGQMHQEEDHAAPILRTPTEAQIRISDPYTPFYGLADASQDHYLSLCLHRAAATDEPVRTEPQPWAGSLLDPTAVGGEPLAPVVDDRGTSEDRL